MIQPLFLALALVVLAVVAACILWPLRGKTIAVDRSQHDLAVYRDQLAEIERDRARGLVQDDQAEAARVEIRRRILRVAQSSPAGAPGTHAAKEGSAPSPDGPERPWSRMTVAALALALPVLGFATYLSLGRPDLPSQLVAERPQARMTDPLPELYDQAARLEEQLARAPDDVQGWLRLGRLQVELGEMDRAIASYRRAVQEAPDDHAIRVELADVLTTAAGGVVTPDARELFEQSLAAAGGEAAADPRAIYFLGVADAQAGDLTGAIERWRRLLARAPAQAPWREQLVDSIRVAASQAGIDPGPLPEGQDRATGGPDAADIEAMAALSPDEQAAQIRAMVDGLDARLQETPDDVEGWLRLGRARDVLNEKDLAAAAYERAAALRPDDPAILAAWGNALADRRHEPTGLPLIDDRAKAVFERLEKLEPGNPQAAWFLGLAAAQAGDRAGAHAYWSALLQGLPPDHPDRPGIQQLVEALSN